MRRMAIWVNWIKKDMIRKILKNIFSPDRFSSEWRKRNAHNFTVPDNHFKMDAVQVGKGTYGKLFIVTRDYQDVRLIIGDYCSIAAASSFFCLVITNMIFFLRILMNC